MWRVKYKGKISPEKYVLEEIDLVICHAGS
jgi:hypothetical protein